MCPENQRKMQVNSRKQGMNKIGVLIKRKPKKETNSKAEKYSN